MSDLAVTVGKKPLFHVLLADLPDIALALFFAFSAVLAIMDSPVGEFLAEELSLWFVYELVGAFFLLLWVAVNEQRWNQIQFNESK